jgi:hypothetical protein
MGKDARRTFREWDSRSPKYRNRLHKDSFDGPNAVMHSLSKPTFSADPPADPAICAGPLTGAHTLAAPLRGVAQNRAGIHALSRVTLAQPTLSTRY